MKTKQSDIENRAHEAWDKGDTKLAFSLFKECANLGMFGCMLDLGYFYDEGIGTKKNKKEAMLWYKKAYRKGCSAAASNIAILYKEKNNNRLSFQWYSRAVKLGDGDARVDLAKLYLNGKGVRPSVTLAKRHLRLALKSKFITEDSREQAASILNELENGL